MEIEDFKHIVIEECTKILKERISAIELELKFLLKDIAEDTKSSAGDKYETSREMANIERGKQESQLAITRKSLNILKNARHTKKEIIAGGNLIRTDKNWIFLSISLGPVTVNNEVVLVITPLSPLGSSFIDLRPGEIVKFNKQDYTIEAIA